jgi:hypothetical protein
MSVLGYTTREQAAHCVQQANRKTMAKNAVREMGTAANENA